MLRLLALVVIASIGTAAPPPTPMKPVTDTYHGVSVVDPYRWLEDGKNPDVRRWSDAQNVYARDYLDKLPGRDMLRARIKEILAAKVVSHYRLEYRPGKLFAMKRQPPKEQPFLVVMPSADKPDQAKTIVDPAVLDAKGTTAIDWYIPSPDGSLVAVSLSKNGSESGDVHIYDTMTAKQVYEVVPRVQNGTAGGDLAWTPDGKGFYYTRYPRGKERPAVGPGFLSASLLSRARHASRERSLRTRQGTAPNSRTAIADAQSDRPTAGQCAEGRRRGIRVLPARTGRQVPAIQ